MTGARLVADTVTVQVPFRLVKIGERKEMQLPHGVDPPSAMDSTLIKVLARAFRWMYRPSGICTG